ncbi:MAG: lysoplasmalogenase [Flavobacteriaceae bacterium]
MQNKVIFFLIFILAGSINLIGQILEIDLLAHGSKALIIPALMGYVWSNNSPSRIYLVALFFSWLGDLFLIPSGTSFFITGIAAFWITQLLYCRLMLNYLKGTLWEQLKKKKNLLPLFLLGGYLFFLLVLISPRLGVIQIPVTLYALTLCITGYLGVLIALEKRTKTALSLALGCILFMISDSMIAFDAFYFDAKVFTYWVMGTYVPAQFFISKHLSTMPKK